MEAVGGWSRVSRWFLPSSQLDLIKRRPTSTQEKIADVATYYVFYCPYASWKDLAWRMYYDNERAAVKKIKSLNVLSKDYSLTTDNVMEIFKDVEDWNKLAWILLVNDFIRSEIETTYQTVSERKKALVEEYVHGHPTPSWEQIASRLSRENYAVLSKGVTTKYIVGSQKEKFLASLEQAIYNKERLEHILVHAALVGPPGSGKSSLMNRLVKRKIVPSSSTGVSTGITCVKIHKSSSVASRVQNCIWSEQDYDDEALGLLTFAEDVLFFKSGEQHHFGHSTPTECEKKEKLAKTDLIPNPNSMLVDSSNYLECFPSEYRPRQQVFSTLVSESERLKAIREKIENSWSLYLTDTGGQMEFQELLPLLISGPSMFFFVFPLNRDLDELFTIEYRPADGSTLSYKCTLTLSDTIVQTLATIASMGSLVDSHSEKGYLKPTLLFVGTHKDMLPPDTATEQIKKVNERIKSLTQCTTFYSEDMIERADDSQILFTVNNLSDEDSDFVKIRGRVEQIAKGGNFTTTSPFHWLIFSLMLRRLTKRVLSYDEAFAVAKDCGITTHQELHSALNFLHSRLGVVRYFNSENIGKIVIRDPQILFDEVTRLVVKTFATESGASWQKCDDFKKKGMFSLADFCKKEQNQLLTSETLVSILEYLRIVVPIKSTDGSTKYFLPCILARYDSCQLEKPFNIDVSKSLPTLLFTFSHGFCPKGLVGALVVYLLRNEMKCKVNWILIADSLFRDRVSFRVNRFADIATIKTHPQYLEIAVNPSDNDRDPSSVCTEVRESVESGIESVMNYTLDKDYFRTFRCQNTDCIQNDPLTEEMLNEGGALWCNKSQKPFPLPIGYHVWFSSTLKENPSISGPKHQILSTSKLGIHQELSIPTCMKFSYGTKTASQSLLDNRPTLAKLMVLKQENRKEPIKIIKTLSPNWKTFGAMVDFDPSGSTLQNIEKDFKGNEACCIRVFELWLAGEGSEPCTWGNLIELLKDCDLKTLAMEIKNSLIHVHK